MNWPEVALAKVEAVYPAEFAVSVTFPNLAMLTAIRVPVAPGNAGPNTGRHELPERGDWGVVIFTQNNERSARWWGTLGDLLRHSAPLELLRDDPNLRTDFERSGRDTYRHGNGDIEVQHPDGSLTRLTHGDAYDKETVRKVSVPQGEARTPTRASPKRKTASPMHAFFKHVSGLIAHLKPSGAATLQGAAGQLLTLGEDGSVELRSPKGACVRLDAAGNVVIEPAPGGFVLLGLPGDQRPVARVGDQTAGGPILPPCSTSVKSS